MRRDLDRIWVVYIAIACICAPAFAQLPPETAEEQLAVAGGLEVTLFASEPDLRNPTSMDVDAEGRVWVTEAANYRVWKNEQGAADGDRIRVLEDTDGDGRCDNAWTYYESPALQAPMGIAVVGKRVYVCQSPELFYLEDTNGDGKADKKTAILMGFNGVDHDHAIHGVVWAPDGRLYFSVGDQGLDVTDRQGNRIHAGKGAPVMAATVLRTDLEGNHLELLAQGMRNPYEPTVDSFGNVFISDNDDDGNEQCRINFVIEGGHYGYWPRRNGDRRLDRVHWNEDRPGVVPKMIKTGFGSPTGILVYEGDHLPKAYHDTLIHADAGPRVIRSYPAERNGAAFDAMLNVMVSGEGDTWFRPSDVSVAPDGSIFIADWYDPGVGGHNIGDLEKGRIYRLAKEGAAYDVPRLDLVSSEGLRDAFASPNRARHYVAYERIAEQLADGDGGFAISLYESADPVVRARATWLLAARGPEPAKVLLKTAKDEDPRFRTLAVRAMGVVKPELLKKADWLVSDSDAGVRRQLVLELGKVADQEWARERLLQLADAFDGRDRFYREALGIAFQRREAWAFRELFERAGREWNRKTAQFAIQFHSEEALKPALAALHSEQAVELQKLTLQALDAIGGVEAGQVIASHVAPERDPAVRAYALQLLQRDGGDVWREAAQSEEFDKHLAEALEHPELEGAAWEFVGATARTSFVPRLMAIANDSTAPISERVRAVEAIRQLAHRIQPSKRGGVAAELAPVLVSGDAALAAYGADALFAVTGNEAVGPLSRVVADGAQPKDVREAVARRLARNREGGLALAELARRDELPLDLTLAVSEILHGSRHEVVREKAAEALPREVTREGQTLPSLQKLLAMEGMAERGKKIFFREDRAQCYRCHAVQGEGRDVGPDLSKIGQKYGKQGLLESILNPSAAIGHEYQVWNFETELHGDVTGYIRLEREGRLEVVNADGEIVVIPENQIRDRWKSELSLMPTGLASGLSVQELADVVAFLETLK